MDRAAETKGLPERLVRLVLLLALWSAWLLLRALWGLVAELVSSHGRAILRRTLAWGGLAALLLLAPHAVGLWWSRLMLIDAAQFAASQAAGREPADLEAELRRAAFKLGFHDLVDQPEAIRVRREEREGGPVCRVEMDFHHRQKLYGWTAPPIRIQARVESYLMPRGGPLDLAEPRD